MENPLYIIGLGMHPDHLCAESLNILDNAQVLIAGKRLLQFFPRHPARKIPLRSPLRELVQQISRELEAGQNVVVLADGDPLYFGIGTYLLKQFGPERIHFEPNITALQAAAARLGIPWQDIQTISLHGRQNYAPLWAALTHKDQVAVYTDPENTPALIAEKLVEKGVQGFRCIVFEDLGHAQEKWAAYSLDQTAKNNFSDLNFMLLKRFAKPDVKLSSGIADWQLVKQKGLITKWPVRAMSLASLELYPEHTLWDLGAGSGSVSIAAASLLHKGQAYAVEKDPGRIKMILENIQKTGAYLVEPVCADMPSGLEHLPDPERIFMGGGLAQGSEILEYALSRLKPGGKIVINTVLLKSLQQARAILEQQNLPLSIMQTQNNHCAPIAGDLRFTALNPVFILAAQKSE